jgi:hypothetical protein
MELYDFSQTAYAKQSDAQRAFRRAELSGLTTLRPETTNVSWFARFVRRPRCTATAPSPAVTVHERSHQRGREQPL